MPSIDELPDEIISRIFTLGSDEDLAPTHVMVDELYFNNRDFVLKKFCKPLTQVCRRWNELIQAKGNRHLWFVAWQVTDSRDQAVVLSRLHAALRNSSGRDLSIVWMDYGIPPVSSDKSSPEGALRLHGLRMLSEYASQLRIFSYYTPSDYSANFILMVMESLGTTPRLRELYLNTPTTPGRSPTPSALDVLPVFPNDLVSNSARNKAGIVKLHIGMTMHGAWTKCIVRVLSTCIDAIGEVGLTFHPVVLYQKPAIGAYYAWSTVERILRLLPSASSLKLTFPNAEFEEFIPGWKSSISFHALDRLTLWANPRHLVGFLSKLEVPMITKLVLESYSTGPQIANDAPREKSHYYSLTFKFSTSEE